jgi:hypothetical protein
MTLYSFMMNQVNEIGNRIKVDPRHYILKYNNSLTIWGEIDAKVTSITYNTRQEVAEVLKKDGRIDKYNGTGDEVTMFKMTLMSDMRWYDIPYEWADVELQFSPLLVKRLLAVKELRLINAITGLMENAAMKFLACFSI